MADVDPLVTAAIQANQSPRYKLLDLYDRYVDGTQYDGRPRFFDDSVALFDRAPCVVVPMVDEAIRSHAALVLGEDHFPSFTSHGDEDDDEEGDDGDSEPEDDEGFGLSREDSKAVDRLIRKICKQTHLQPVARQLLEAAMGCGTAVAILGVKQGKLCIDSTFAKWSTPKFADDGSIESLEIRYPYEHESKDPKTGDTVVEALIYRRVIDAKTDTVYKPAKASRNGAEPDYWAKDREVEHKLGFCPVVWYRHMAPVTMVGAIDGRALHRLVLEEIDALNFAVSQRHRATVTTLDPVLAEIGVDEDDPPPAPLVDQATSLLMSPQALAQEQRTQNAWGGGGGRRSKVRQGRMRAPGMAWQYPNPETKLELLTLPGDALIAGNQNASDLEAKICEALHWVPMDPKTLQITSTLSGKAIEWLHKKQIEWCNEVRTDAGEHLLLALLSMLIRIALVVGGRAEGGLYLTGAKAAIPILQRFEREQRQADSTTRKVWMPPEIDLVWPPYFPPTDLDDKATGDNVRSDLQANIITRRTALEKRARFYGIANVDQYLETAEAEKQAAQAIAAPPGAPPGADGSRSGAPGGDDGAAGPISPAGSAAAGAAPKGSSAPKLADGEFKANANSAGIADEVYAQLAEDFPKDALEWIKSASWKGPVMVPLSQIDFSNRKAWKASKDPDHVAEFVQKIESGGQMKPIILVNEPNSKKLIIVDGHHRALAYEKLGRDALAFVATVGTEGGPWMNVHATQRADAGADAGNDNDDEPISNRPAA